MFYDSILSASLKFFICPKLFINLHLAWKKPAVLPAVLRRLPASISRSTEFSESSSSKPATRSYKEDRAWKKMVLSETTWNNRVIFCVALPQCKEETPARRDVHRAASAHGETFTPDEAFTHRSARTRKRFNTNGAPTNPLGLNQKGFLLEHAGKLVLLESPSPN